jgi:hypothetical protein
MKGKNKICMSHKNCNVNIHFSRSLQYMNHRVGEIFNLESQPEIGGMFNLTHLGLHPRGKIQCNLCFICENLPKSKTI